MSGLYAYCIPGCGRTRYHEPGSCAQREPEHQLVPAGWVDHGAGRMHSPLLADECWRCLRAVVDDVRGILGDHRDAVERARDRVARPSLSNTTAEELLSDIVVEIDDRLRAETGDR